MKTIAGFFNLKKNLYLRTFLIALGISFAFFIPFIIKDKGYFFYYGDFNVQQISFYQMIHDAVRNGGLGWNWTTDLGSNIISSYSFYLLGSPFFWLTIPFSSETVPYLMAPLLMLKFAFAALTSFIFLKRYVKNKNFAILGGLLYAFSGFMIYNIFFNHFHEAVIMFPLILAAVDEYMETGRKGLVALAICASCVVNYYFFVGQVVFTVIYWIVRLASFDWSVRIRDFFRLAFEAIIGLFLSCFILLPTILTVIQNPRLDNFPNGWSALLYGYEQRYLHIIECFFFPPDIPARPNFTPDSNAKWSSLGAWLPLFGMTGVIAFLQNGKQKWLKRLLYILFITALVPVLNSVFQLFNVSYYARWFYMITLMLSLATIISFENSNVNWNRAIKYSATITIAIAAAIGFMRNKTTKDGEEKIEYGLMKYKDRFWIYVSIALISIACVSLLLRCLKSNPKVFYICTSVVMSIVIVGSSIYIIGIGKAQGYNVENFLIPNVVEGKEKININDKDKYRVDFYETIDNLGMFWQMPTIQAFHSVVTGSIMEFYKSIGVSRDVASRPDSSVYGVRALTSVKYLFDRANDGSEFDSNVSALKDYTDKIASGEIRPEDMLYKTGVTKMPGWKYYDMQNGFYIYENEYYIPFGFTYDYYITEQQYEEVSETLRHLLLLKGIVLSDEQIEKYKDILEPCYVKYETGMNITDDNVFTYTENQYYKDCMERRELTCSSFEYNSYGFTAEITTGDKAELVFFSVPYEDGWSAYVNGEQVDVEKVNIGFMAVKVPGNMTSKIEFKYETPGLKTGIYITITTLIILILYMIFFKVKNFGMTKKKLKKRHNTFKIKSVKGNSQLADTIRTKISYDIDTNNIENNSEIIIDNNTDISEDNTEQGDS